MRCGVSEANETFVMGSKNSWWRLDLRSGGLRPRAGLGLGGPSDRDYVSYWQDEWDCVAVSNKTLYTWSYYEYNLRSNI